MSNGFLASIDKALRKWTQAVKNRTRVQRFYRPAASPSPGLQMTTVFSSAPSPGRDHHDAAGGERLTVNVSAAKTMSVVMSSSSSTR
jgi:hypothetical protein